MRLDLALDRAVTEARGDRGSRRLGRLGEAPRIARLDLAPQRRALAHPIAGSRCDGARLRSETVSTSMRPKPAARNSAAIAAQS